MIFRKLSGGPAWDYNEFDRLRRQMEWLSNGFTEGREAMTGSGVFPLVNVTEDMDHYHIRAELPGIKAGDIEISVTGNTLSLSGERKIPEEKDNVKYHRRERESGKFSRIITLPAPINTTKVAARSGEGILTVTLPKADEAKPRQITIQAA
ncbi:MAG: Hsp20/alpha crystallin family protein [Desulfobacteraceae bacterium]|nr:MAG: Hsp20/alpha crystallin family protein [Desulfobacteraceae bacterium]